MALLEKDLKHFIVSDPSLSWPKFFKRYFDDGLKIALYSLAETKKFIELYNRLVPSINLTLESHGTSVNFLDLKIFKGHRFLNKNKLDIRTYQKPLNLYLYIPFSSNHPKSVFKGFVVGELRRYIITNSFEKDYIYMTNLFFDRLTKKTANYRPQFLYKWFNSFKYSDRRLMIFPKSTMSPQEESSTEGQRKPLGTDELLIYKTQYDKRFQQVQISQIIREGIETAAWKTKDPELKEFLENVKPLVCFTKNDNLSNVLVRANVKHYTS